MPPPDVSIVVLFHDDCSDRLLARLQAAERAGIGRADHEWVVVGHGSAEDSALIARRLLAVRPDLRLLLHSRPCSADEAMLAGVEFARGNAVVLLGNDAEASGEPVARQQFLQLPRIRGMHRYLPELLALSRSDRRADRSTPGIGARAPFVQWIRNRWVAFLCRLSPASIPRPPAFP